MKNVYEIVNKAYEQIREYPELRYGQAIWNVLDEVDRSVAAKLHGTDADCFYNDERVTLCLTRVEEYWNTK